MRNLIIFIITIISIVYMRCENNNLDKFEQPEFSKTPPILSDEQKQWLLALPAIIMEVNQSSHYTLEVNPISKESIRARIHFLNRWWGVTDRYDLLRVIRRLELYGTRYSYQKITSLIQDNPTKRPGDIVNQYKLNFKEAGYLFFIVNNNLTDKNVNITGWDLGRATSLIRWGYTAGYISEDEAWNMLLYFGRLIQSNFNSWQEYGASYAFGRKVWAAGAAKSEEEYNEETQTTLAVLFSENGLWRKRKWHLELE